MRLIPHTAAYWLMLKVRGAIPCMQPLAGGEFSTIRLRLLQIAVRIKETTTGSSWRSLPTAPMLHCSVD